MTQEEFEKIKPGKTIIKSDGVEMLVKFFACNPGEKFDGYWLCCTEDLSNPFPTEFKDDDWNIYPDSCELIKYE